MIELEQDAVLVGVDGSPESLSAARWAADEAERRRSALHLVCAYEVPATAYLGGAGAVDLDGDLRAGSEALLADTAAHLANEYPNVSITCAVRNGDARRVIVEESHHTHLVILGTRGRGRVPQIVTGSVASYVAAHGQCPVVLVPATVAPGNGPILLGVDGLPNSAGAVRFAFEEAAARSRPLHVVLAAPHGAPSEALRSAEAVHEVTRGGHGPATPSGAIGESPSEHAVLAEQIAGWRQKYPDVPVHPHVLAGRPAEVLLGWRAPDGAGTPSLIVVGTRGRGAAAGLVLGSTSQRVIAHATVPVAVVAPPFEV